jgi:hypothetical protein
MPDELELVVTPPPEVVVEVVGADPPMVQLNSTPPPEVVTAYAVGPQGPEGPKVPLNELPQATAPVDLAGFRLTNLGDPEEPQDAVTSAHLEQTLTTLVDNLKPGPINQSQALINENFSLSENYNGLSVGPVTISPTSTVTIPSNSTWVIL